LKQYPINKIRNVALLGHGKCGKTSLAEAMLYLAKATDRLGKTADGNTICDFDPEEVKRKISISMAIAPIEWRDTKINIIDTPGMFDFAGEVVGGIRAADFVVIAVSGKSGVNVGTEKAWKSVSQNKLPCAFFVGKLCEENADFYKVLEQLKTKFGAAVCPIVVPFGDTYINLIEHKAYKYDDKGNSKVVPMPDDMGHRLEGLEVAMSEAVAETNEEFFEKYFSGEPFSRNELITGIHEGIKKGTISPVFCGDSLNLQAIDLLLDDLVDIFLAPGEKGGEMAKKADGEIVEIPYDETKPLAAIVFKTVADPFVGKLSYFKVISGVMKPETQVYNVRTGQTEKVGKLLTVRGKKQTDVDMIVAGDIGAVAKMTSPITGDTLCAINNQVELEGLNFPEPCLSLAIMAHAKGDEEKITQGLHRLMEEDPTFILENNIETHQQIVSGLGEMHLDVIVSKLKAKFGVAVDLEPPKVAYRETIRKKVKVEGKHKKQTGGHGQFGHVWIEFEPGPTEELVFVDHVVGGAVPRNFFPAVEKGLRDSTSRGVLAGYPVVNIKATLVDGSYHPVDSSEMSFKMAAVQAFKAGIAQANPTLLEPIGHLKALVPDAIMGDIIGDINKRRGRVLGMNPGEDSMQEIEAEVPMSEMSDFAVAMRSVSQGRGSFSLKFERYEDAPPQVSQKVISEAKHIVEEE
jgi:elongation factor G